MKTQLTSPLGPASLDRVPALLRFSSSWNRPWRVKPDEGPHTMPWRVRSRDSEYESTEPTSSSASVASW